MFLLWRKHLLFLYLLMVAAALQAQDQPSVAGSFPHEGSTDILRNAFISVKLSLPNGHLDSYSVNTQNIKLYPKGNPEETIPAFITLNNKLRSLIFEPYGMLEANTAYTFEISDKVKDQEGVPFASTSFTFETGERAYRKLMTMNRPFGDKPAPGEWKEKDVSGENLSAPFLREATPVSRKAEVVEEPKPLKPERSRDELLALVLRFYGGPKLPPGFGPTVLDAPNFPSLPVARMREIPVSFETLMELAQVWPEDTIEEVATEPAIVLREEPSKENTIQELEQASGLDPEMSIRDKWIMASLDELSMEFAVAEISAPQQVAPTRLAKKKPDTRATEVERLLTQVNEAFLEEEKQAQLALEAKARAREARAEEMAARERKTAMQDKWRKARLEDVSFSPTLTIPTLPQAQSPQSLAGRESSMSAEEFETLLTEVNQTLIEEEKQEQIAMAEEAEAAKAQEVQAELQASEQRKVAMQDKWSGVSLESKTIQSAPIAISPPSVQMPTQVAERESEEDTDEFESLLAEVNETLIAEDKQEQIAMAEEAEAAKAREAKVELQASEQRKVAMQDKWSNVSLESETIQSAPTDISLPSVRMPDQVTERESAKDADEFESLLAEVNETLIAEDKQEQEAMARETEAARVREVEAELQASLQRKTAMQTKWRELNLEDFSFEPSLTSIPAPEAQTPGKLAMRKPEVNPVDVEVLLAEVNIALIEEAQAAQKETQVQEPTISQAQPEPSTQSQDQNPTPVPEAAPVSSSGTIINTASLLVEETIKNKDRAGKIVFPQTAIFINEYVLVEFDLPEREFVSFVLRDIKGDVYRTEGGYVEAGPHKRAVTLEGVPAGAYEAVVETIHQKVVRKVTILE